MLCLLEQQHVLLDSDTLNYFSSVFPPAIPLLIDGVPVYDEGAGTAGNWWASDNVLNYARSFSEIWSSLQGNQTPDTLIVHQQREYPGSRSSQGFAGLLVVILLLVLTIIIWAMWRKKK